MNRWKIRYNNHNHLWDVWTPDGTWSGSFTTWVEAMSWATDMFERMQYWMAAQPKPWSGSGFWGQDVDTTDDQGFPRGDQS